MTERTKSREELDKAWADLDAKYAELIRQCDIAVWVLVSAAPVTPSMFLLAMWLFS